MNIKEKLNLIQVDLKAPKNQVNNHMKFKFRSCEDILTAVKPLLKKHKVILTISDKIEEVGGRIYVVAQAEVSDCEAKIEEAFVIRTSGYAREREVEDRKGMDAAQVTGAASSYARKYALNGLFAIDDSKDVDSQDNTQPAQAPVQSPVQYQAPVAPAKPVQRVSELDKTKMRITRILKKLNPMLETKKEYIDFSKDNTGLDLIETNFDEILNRLIILEKDIKENK